MFSSMAKSAKAKGIGVILTGLGRDGAQGLLAMRQAGAKTIGQNEKSCVVYGMPKVAKEIGAVQREHHISKIGRAIIETSDRNAIKSVSDNAGDVITTILGSCVATCLYDPIAKIGGMNHFLLPGEKNAISCSSESYGLNAMELLINSLLKLGAKRILASLGTSANEEYS